MTDQEATPETLEDQYYDGLEIEQMVAHRDAWRADRARLLEVERAARDALQNAREYAQWDIDHQSEQRLEAISLVNEIDAALRMVDEVLAELKEPKP